jgi:hypothetical protein
MYVSEDPGHAFPHTGAGKIIISQLPDGLKPLSAPKTRLRRYISPASSAPVDSDFI